LGYDLFEKFDIQLVRKDGHSSGIYSREYLRGFGTEVSQLQEDKTGE